MTVLTVITTKNFPFLMTKNLFLISQITVHLPFGFILLLAWFVFFELDVVRIPNVQQQLSDLETI